MNLVNICVYKHTSTQKKNIKKGGGGDSPMIRIQEHVIRYWLDENLKPSSITSLYLEGSGGLLS